MKAVVPNYLPVSLAQDAWWLADLSTGGDPRGPLMVGRNLAGRVSPRLLCLIVLIAIADWLLWGHYPGVSIAVLMLAVLCCAGLTAKDRPSKEAQIRATLVFVAANMPVINATGFLPIVFAIVGTLLAVFTLRGEKFRNVSETSINTFRHLFFGPIWFFAELLGLAREANSITSSRRTVNRWIVPVGLGLLFLSLLVSANPFFESSVSALLGLDWLRHINLARILFWLGIAALCWPYIATRAWVRSRQTVRSPRRAAPLLLDQAAIRNALIVFNIMFAIQTATDAFYLWGGVDLPSGMTYAEYAHRGAYPLLVTALLAGAFMMIATSFEPIIDSNRIWMYVWLAQNVLLVVSSVLRLNLYVEVYSLTYLRVSAFIWMGLVVAGLILIAIRLAKEHSNRWVVSRVCLLAIGTLYACCFVNFASLIGHYNVAHSLEVSGTGQNLDQYYLCSLGPEAYPAADRFREATGNSVAGFHEKNGSAGWLFDRFETQNKNWRSWGIRDARLRRYLSATYQSAE